jgi:hypothetical protein
VTDIKQLELKLYNLSRIWWVRWTQHQPSEIVLVPDTYPSNILGVDPCPKEPLKNFAPDKRQGDGYSYQVPLGEPIVRMSLKEEQTEDQRNRIRNCLDKWLAFEFQNIFHFQTKIPYSEDILKFKTNEPPDTPGSVSTMRHYVSHEVGSNITPILLSITPAIASLIRNLYAQNQLQEVAEVLSIARLARRYGAVFRAMVDSMINQHYDGH